jgi:hypothetical protein
MHSWPLHDTIVDDMADGGSYWLATTASAIGHVLNRVQLYTVQAEQDTNGNTTGADIS